jgi:hypothetical protein
MEPLPTVRRRGGSMLTKGITASGFINSSSRNFFMLRTGLTEDYVKNTTASNFVLDWPPVFIPLYIHYPFHLSYDN